MKELAVGFPRDEAEREVLRQLMPGIPLPAIYPDSVDMKCEFCPRILAVGPRVRTVVLFDKVPLCCVQCMKARFGGIKPGDALLHLGNPERHLEGE